MSTLRGTGLHLSVIPGGQSSCSAVTCRDWGKGKQELPGLRSLAGPVQKLTAARPRRQHGRRGEGFGAAGRAGGGSLVISGQEGGAECLGTDPEETFKSSRSKPYFTRAQGFIRVFLPPSETQ